MGSEDLVASALLLGAQHSSDVIVLFDGDLRLQWMNPFGCKLLGYELEHIIGESALSYVHPDDVARVALSIARVLDPTLDLPLKPAPARLRTSTGAHVNVDVNGGGYPAVDGREGGFFLVCRPDAEAELHTELMDLLTNEAPSAKAFALVPAFGEWRQPLLWHASFHRDDEGTPTATGSPELLALGGLNDDTAPWSAVASKERRWFGSLDDLDRRIAHEPRRRDSPTSALSRSGTLCTRLTRLPCSRSISDRHNQPTIRSFACRNTSWSPPRVSWPW